MTLTKTSAGTGDSGAT